MAALPDAAQSVPRADVGPALAEVPAVAQSVAPDVREAVALPAASGAVLVVQWEVSCGAAPRVAVERVASAAAVRVVAAAVVVPLADAAELVVRAAAVGLVADAAELAVAARCRVAAVAAGAA